MTRLEPHPETIGPRPSSFNRLWSIVSTIGYIGLLVLSLVPGSMRPSTGEGHHFEHFVAYMLVGISFALAVRTTGMRVSSLVLLAATSGALELLQHLVPGRTPEFAGFLFSSLGAAMGILVTTVVLAVIKKSTRV